MPPFNPLEHPIIFSQPLRLMPSTWIEHVPFGMFAVDILRPKVVVELGAYYGVSYCAFCQAVKELKIDAKCYAVDTWQGDSQSGYFGSEVLDDLRKHHDPLYADFSRLIQSTFDEAVHHFEDGAIDLLHIDGYHTYEAVKHDFETWLPKMSRNGVILFHDTNVKEKDFGAWKLWAEVSKLYPGFEFLHGYGLGVLSVARGGATPLQPLLDAASDGRTLIRDLFFQLGKGIELRYEVIEAQKEVVEAQKESQELQNAFNEQSSELQRQAAIAQEQIRTWENKWADLEAGFTWKALKKIQAIRLKLAPIGSAQDRFIRRFVHAVMLWRQEGFRALLTRLRDKFANQPAMIAVRNNAEAKEVSPTVSIVIPVFNAIEMTKLCLESIYRSKINNPYEIIIVDNASTDGTSRWVSREQKKHSQLKYFSMGENIGFGPAVNYGIRKSKGDFIVILNNDTIVSSNWLENLIAPLEEDRSVGIISPLTNYVGEGPQIDTHAQHLMPDLDAVNAYAGNIELRSQLYYEPNRLVFFCVALRRELIDKIGYLDESYEKGNFEDDDYCLRARIAGFRLAIAENSFVYHHGSATFKKNQISHSEYMQRNREQFYKKAGRISTTVPLAVSRSELTGKDVSVIVRTKDRPLLLKRALASLANQTYKDFEVVLVNDGGEDVSDVLKMFESYYATQYVYHQTSKGRTAAVNAGIDHSKGRWISYLDDDDIIYPWHLEALIQALKSSGKKFVYSNYNRSLFLNTKMHSPNVLVGTPPWEYSRKELLIQNHIPIHTWMHDRECLDTVGLWDEKFDRLEDYDFLLRLSAEYDLFHLNKFTCEYRYYVESANSIYTDREKTVEALAQIYKKNKVEDATLLARRQEVIDTLTKQTQTIEKIKSQVGDKLTETTANREIIRLVVGI